MSKDRLVRILADFRNELAKILGDRLKAIYLYGSQARGEAKSDSDIDVLVVIRTEFDYFDLLDRTTQLVSNLSLENDVVISPVFVTKEQYLHHQIPLLINVRREGIAV